MRTRTVARRPGFGLPLYWRRMVDEVQEKFRAAGKPVPSRNEVIKWLLRRRRER